MLSKIKRKLKMFFSKKYRERIERTIQAINENEEETNKLQMEYIIKEYQNRIDNIDK